MLKKILSIFILNMAFVGAAFAQTAAQGGLNVAASNISAIIIKLTQAAYFLAFLAFFWGIALVLFAKSDDKQKKGTQTIIWSVIAIFVMTSIWGIVKVLQGTLGATDNKMQDLYLPQLQMNTR